jgi:hypothetical protein
VSLEYLIRSTKGLPCSSVKFSLGVLVSLSPSSSSSRTSNIQTKVLGIKSPPDSLKNKHFLWGCFVISEIILDLKFFNPSITWSENSFQKYEIYKVNFYLKYFFLVQQDPGTPISFFFFIHTYNVWVISSPFPRPLFLDKNVLWSIFINGTEIV